MVFAVESDPVVVSELERRCSKRPGEVVCDGAARVGCAVGVAIPTGCVELGGVQMTQADSI